jgi:hypothetical protein
MIYDKNIRMLVYMKVQLSRITPNIQRICDKKNLSTIPGMTSKIPAILISFLAALGPTQPPIQWVPGALSLGVKRPGREADHSLPSSAEVKNVWSYTSTPPIRLHGVMLC